ncbi:hypothetical protein Ae201684_000049 [Aphanomyces euteiches]|uniref:GST C-terminal domain-containing protein n=1 Tax=Aphanomyces euteiches TaxID=100861 RepID=A0A6G0XYA9_9STRA|nr:hypothetical protein Ae201684_000049 [Aphanomyces euteiches]KAH9155939.1 hypothetical protein AeRB84_002133 [Aphanomyces euteiches]
MTGEFIRDAPDSKFPAEAGRYHVYVALNCPWCHRVALTRALLGLEDAVSMDVALPTRSSADHPTGENNWLFQPEGLTALNGRFVRYDNVTMDTVNGFLTARQIYEHYGVDQRSLPILLDVKSERIVNNESSEMIRMFATELAPRFGNGRQLYPPELAAEIDELNGWIYTQINNGAYRAGFTSNQDAYEAAFVEYFAALDRLESILATRTWLTGDTLTEADVRLFPTIFRHDPVYFVRMKLNQAFIRDYPNLSRWLKQFYALPGVAAVSPIDQIKEGYFGRTWNNTVPVGPKWFTPDYLLNRRTLVHRLGGSSRLVSPNDAIVSRLKPFVSLQQVPEDAQSSLPLSGVAVLSYRPSVGIQWTVAGGGTMLQRSSNSKAFELWTQEIGDDQIPKAGNARILLGTYHGIRGAIEPPAALTLLEVELRAGETFTYDAAGHQVCWAFVYEGAVDFKDSHTTEELLVFSDDGQVVNLEANYGPCRFFIASVVRSTLPLYADGNSVHTTAAALTAGQAKVQELARSRGK